MFENPANIYYKSCLFYTVRKVMDDQKHCTTCHEKKGCQSIYQQLGNINTPSVLAEVTIAFLLPLLVFIGFLAVFGQIFSKTIDTKVLQTPLSFLLSLSATFALILIIKVTRNHSGENR